MCVLLFVSVAGKTNDNLVRVKKQNKKRITFLRPCVSFLFAERENMVGRAGALFTSLAYGAPPQGNHSGRL